MEGSADTVVGAINKHRRRYALPDTEEIFDLGELPDNAAYNNIPDVTSKCHRVVISRERCLSGCWLLVVRGFEYDKKDCLYYTLLSFRFVHQNVEGKVCFCRKKQHRKKIYGP